jgi:galactokinase
VSNNFTTSAPGRVCLFGEHQDYLGMSSIVMAINLRLSITFSERSDRKVVWSSPKLGIECKDEFDLDDLEASVGESPNHMLSSMIEARDEGRLPEKGWDAVIMSDVPVRAGCSSSSALVIAWIAGMQRLSGNITSPIELAMEAFRAEVTHYNAPGGNMDHIACAVGGPLRVDPSAHNGYVQLPDSKFDWVLGDSNSPKDTMGILERCKFSRLAILEYNGGVWDDINLTQLSPSQAELVKGTIRNRDIEIEAAEMFLQDEQIADILGPLMSEHHSILRDVLEVSSNRIEAMCNAALNAGASGSKIFGSGGGGCMLAMIARPNGDVDSDLINGVKNAIEGVDGAIAHHVKSELGVCWGEDLEVVNPVVVLAAGASSRMKKVVDDVSEFASNEAASRPKAMLRVGTEKTPFLELLLNRIKEEGSNCVIIVVGESDNVTRDYFTSNSIDGLEIRFVTQSIPTGRIKPLGTAHAMEVALSANTDLNGLSVVVCNGDNMPPQGSFEKIFTEPCAMLAYDSSALGLPDDRTSAFAVVSVNGDGTLDKIHEKPSVEIAMKFRDAEGLLRVSMNTFKLPYSDFLSSVRNCPLSERGERELPTAIQIWTDINPGRVIAIPFSGVFLDLTHPEDIEFVMNKLKCY